MSAFTVPLPKTPRTWPRAAEREAARSTAAAIDEGAAASSNATSNATSTSTTTTTNEATARGASTLTVAPPPLPRRGERRDALAPNARRAMVLAIVTLHLVAIWGVLQIREVRDVVTQAVPMFVNLVAPDTPPPKPLEPPPPPVARQPVKQTPTPAAVIAAAPSPTPSTFETPAPSPVAAEPSPPAPAVVVAAAPAAVAPPPPKIIPASMLQYLKPIDLEYPRLAQRNHETGVVMVRAWIDETGRPGNVTVNRSSGHSRLDEAALAAVQRARFKPYTENGIAIAGWAFIPLEFELEK